MAKQAKLIPASRENRRNRRRQLRVQLHRPQSSSQPAIHARNVRLRAVRAANNSLADALARSGAISKVTAKNIRARWTKKAQQERFAAAEALGAGYEGEGAYKLLTEEEMVEENGGRGVGVEDAGEGEGEEWKGDEEEGGAEEGEEGEEEEEEEDGDEDEEMEEGADTDVEEETAGPGNMDPNWMPALPERRKQPE